MKLFRIYPELWQNKRYYYVTVEVFDTRKNMAASLAWMSADTVDKSCEGQCSGHARYDKHCRLTGHFATIWLNTEDLKAHAAEIISHECTHAAMRHIINKKFDLSVMGGEEALAYCIGSMSQQVNDRLHKIGVFE